MPEGPTIVILCEEAAHLVGMRIKEASGNTQLDAARFVGRKIVALRSWGKHFLVEFDRFTLRVHFLLFGRYAIDSERKGATPRLHLAGARGELNLYASALRLIEEPLDEVYDWRGDVMSDAWSPSLARRKLAERPNLLACDALLDQDVFAGVGNIIKNEVLFRIHAHPASRVGALPPVRRNAMVREARTYAFEFLKWKKANVLKRHLLVHAREECPECAGSIELATLGTTKRRAFFCPRCQVRYGDGAHARKRTTRRRAG